MGERVLRVQAGHYGVPRIRMTTARPMAEIRDLVFHGTRPEAASLLLTEILAIVDERDDNATLTNRQ